MALKQIKNKIIATKKTGQVTKAMESVSAVKMRKSQEKALSARPYVYAALHILSQVSAFSEVEKHALMHVRQKGRRLVVIVTSDKGLAGSVNSAVLKKVEQLLQESREIDVIAIGRKAVEFAVREKLTVVGEYTNVTDDVSIADVQEMALKALRAFTVDDTYREVLVVYQNFLSTFEQKPELRTMLPLSREELVEIMSGITPKKGKGSDDTMSTTEDASIAYTIEPSAEEVFETLVEQLVQVVLYHALIESKASEHSARMVAMKNATDKSKEVAKALTLTFNKARQAAITAEVSEITGGIEALKE